MEIPELFAQRPPRQTFAHPRPSEVPTQSPDNGREFAPSVDDRLLDLYSRVDNPEDPFKLRDLYLARVEAEISPHGDRSDLARLWLDSRPCRRVDAEQVLCCEATVRFVKELFNWYFQKDLYGQLRPQAEIILSGGAVDEEQWGLPWALKECIRYALDRDWYGYSDSRGRDAVREAVAAYENSLTPGAPYNSRNIALTMGATFTISALADFIMLGSQARAPALCGIPNYPPLVQSVARRVPVRLVPTASRNGVTSLDPLISALTPDTPLILIQTASNPTGALVSELDLVRLVNAASPSTMILLDECHEWLGDPTSRSSARAAPNVIRVTSLSKDWSAPGLKIGWLAASTTFIDEYYEYASTTFGGPPSFFYTLVEILARMERWRVTGVEQTGPDQCAEFEKSYRLDPARLDIAYESYRRERATRADDLIHLRDAAIAGCDLPGVEVIPARYSINLAINFSAYNDSYRCFRDVLRETGVSLFPGILTFCMSQGILRLTTARKWTDLTMAIARLSHFAASRNARC
jgi:aspartate/methionine/tyrosine aminotransferase